MSERRIILALAAIFCFGYTFHQLWLVYDLACIWAAFHVLGPAMEPRVRALAGWMVVLVASWFAISASLHPTSMIWALAIWDTLKHVFLWLYLLRSCYGTGPATSFLKSAELYRWFSIAFGANVLVAVYQFASGDGVDDIAGLFGPGATQSFGYFLILYFLLAYQRGERGPRLLAILVVSAVLAVIGESMGFFLLLPLWFLALQIESKRSFASFAAGGVAIVAMLVVLAKLQPEFVDAIVSRAQSVVVPDGDLTSDHAINGRGTAVAYASLVGGWTGDGPGTYSNIYGMEGSGSWLLEIVQLEISEVSHLLAEWGAIGLGFVIGVFALLHAALRTSAIKRLMLFAIWLACLAHGAFLMDERLIFFEMLTALCLLCDDAPAPPQRDQDPCGTERESGREAGHDHLATVRA
ncbi:hypothetical protein BH11MYX1_BH11MYX1_40350 [soil metagenome]